MLVFKPSVPQGLQRYFNAEVCLPGETPNTRNLPVCRQPVHSAFSAPACRLRIRAQDLVLLAAHFVHRASPDPSGRSVKLVEDAWLAVPLPKRRGASSHRGDVGIPHVGMAHRLDRACIRCSGVTISHQNHPRLLCLRNNWATVQHAARCHDRFTKGEIRDGPAANRSSFLDREAT